MRRIIRDMSAKVLPGILSFKYMRMAILNGYLKGKGFFFFLSESNFLENTNLTFRPLC